MRWPFALVLVLFNVAGFAQEPLSKRAPLPNSNWSAGRLRVVTYNILGGRNTDGSRDLGRVADVIRSLNADLVALQEVDVKTGRIKGVDVPAELAKLTGLTSAFAEAMPYDGGSYGEAVLTKLEVVQQIDHKLPHLKGHEPRAALELRCRIPGTKFTVTFIATHLDHLRQPDGRAMQVAKIRELFTEKTLTAPAILAGDLNATPESAEIKKLIEAWRPTWPADMPGFTFRSDKPTRRIDYIFTHPATGWNTIKVFRGNDVFADDPTWLPLLHKASDHLPVIAELELRSK